MLAPLKNTLYKKISLGLIFYMLGIYIVESLSLVSFMGSDVYNYILKPLAFGIPAILLYKSIPRVHLEGKQRHKPEIYIWAFNCAVAYMVIQIIVGFIQGFGKSPYSHSLIGILSNLYMVGSVLVARECIRGYIVQSYAKQKKLMIPIALLMTVLSIRMSLAIKSLDSIQGVTEFLAETMLPEFGNHVLATYLALYGGPLASIIYLGILEVANWLSPILPNLNWLAKGMIGIMIPTFATFYISDAYKVMSRQVKVYREKKENIVASYITMALAIGMIWFVVGVFPLYPSAVVTGSMQPVIEPGDVVVIEKITTEEKLRTLEVGDIIQYEREGILIVHRIVEVIEKDGIPSYRTKGDNNSVEDGAIVEANQIKGKVKQIVPKIGWPTLLLKRTDENVKEQVEF